MVITLTSEFTFDTAWNIVIHSFAVRDNIPHVTITDPCLFVAACT